MVCLETFGSTLQSVEKLACISLFIITLSIIAHLMGKPYGTESGKAWRLHIMELAALFVIWFVNWGGLMIYLGTDAAVSTFLTCLIVFAITCYLAGALLIFLYA